MCLLFVVVDSSKESLQSETHCVVLFFGGISDGVRIMDLFNSFGIGWASYFVSFKSIGFFLVNISNMLSFMPYQVICNYTK